MSSACATACRRCGSCWCAVGRRPARTRARSHAIAQVILEAVAAEYMRDSLDVLALSYVFSSVNEMSKSRDVYWTRDEQAHLVKVFDALEQCFIQRLSQYHDYFPYNTPPGFLRHTVRALAVIYANPMFREAHEHAKDMEKVLAGCVSNSCMSLFTRLQAMSIPMVRSASEAAGMLKRVSTLVELVLRELDTDALYFRDDFSYFDGSRMIQLDLVTAATGEYCKLLSADLESELATVVGRQFKPEVFAVYDVIRKFRARCASVSEASEVGALRLEDIMAPYVYLWLNLSRVRAHEWAAEAIRVDKVVSAAHARLRAGDWVSGHCAAGRADTGRGTLPFFLLGSSRRSRVRSCTQRPWSISFASSDRCLFALGLAVILPPPLTARMITAPCTAVARGAAAGAADGAAVESTARDARVPHSAGRGTQLTYVGGAASRIATRRDSARRCAPRATDLRRGARRVH